MDSERVVWIRVHGVSCHAWSVSFLECLANIWGVLFAMMGTLCLGATWILAEFL